MLMRTPVSVVLLAAVRELDYFAHSTVLSLHPPNTSVFPSLISVTVCNARGNSENSVSGGVNLLYIFIALLVILSALWSRCLYR